MKKQAVDSLLLESLVSTTSLESLAKGYILNCKTEGKSPKTISGYEMALRNFIWYCRQNDFPEVQKLTTLLIQHRRHNISPIDLLEFKERILSRISQGEAEWRSKDEILEAEEEFFAKVWYGRHKLLESMVESGRKEVTPEIWQKALKTAKKLEEKYGKEQLGSWDDFEWGMLSGKLSALRWVSGDDWDMLDT